MPVSYNVQITGVLPEDSLNTFKNAYNKTSKMSNYQQYQDEIEAYFLSRVEENIRHQGIDDNGLTDGLTAKITDDKIEFRSDNPNLINAIEYGSAHQVGQRFMQPAVIDVGNYMSEKILGDATSYYSNNAPIRSRVEYGYGALPTIGSNKYGFMLK